MAVTFSTDGKFVAGTTGVACGKLYVYTNGSATTYNMPKTSTTNGTVPADFYFYLQFTDGNSNAATLAAQSGETIAGDTTSTLANELFIITRKGSTSWYAKSLTLDVDTDT
jgi:hypothetical protein